MLARHETMESGMARNTQRQYGAGVTMATAFRARVSPLIRPILFVVPLQKLPERKVINQRHTNFFLDERKERNGKKKRGKPASSDLRRSN